MIRIGIVGCGRILAAHLQGYQLLREAGYDNFRITALCARKREDAESYVRRGVGPAQRTPVGSSPGDPLAVGDLYLSDFQPDTEVAVYTNYQEMIESGPVDAVNDFTTHALHHQVAESALGHGKHLLTQKPLAVSVAAGRGMCELAESRGVTLGVFENARNRADTRQLGWLFRSGLCGQLQMISMLNLGNWWAPDQIVAQTPWRHDRLEGGGLALDIGVHLFNHLRYVAGEIESVGGRAAVLEPARKSAGSETTIKCDADDTVLVDFDTRNGVVGSIAASWGGHGQPMRLGATRGLAYWGSAGNVVDDVVTLDSREKSTLNELYGEGADEEELQRYFPNGLQNAFALNQLDWLEAIREDRPPETSGREGLRDLAAAYAILESSQVGRRVSVDEVEQGQLRSFQAEIDARFGLA